MFLTCVNRFFEIIDQCENVCFIHFKNPDDYKAAYQRRDRVNCFGKLLERLSIIRQKDQQTKNTRNHHKVDPEIF